MRRCVVPVSAGALRGVDWLACRFESRGKVFVRRLESVFLIGLFGGCFCERLQARCVLATGRDKVAIKIICGADHNQIEWCERSTTQTHHCYPGVVLTGVLGRNKGPARDRWFG